MPFDIDFGVFCSTLFRQKTICFFPQQEMPTTRSAEWICGHNTTHDVTFLRIWFSQKKTAERCADNCQGLGKLELEHCLLDKHLLRVALPFESEGFYNLFFHLGLSHREWTDLSLQFQHDNPINMKCMALFVWKQKEKGATFAKLKDAMEECNLNIHCLCQVFREEEINTKDLDLRMTPTLLALQKLSNHLGEKSVQLGIKLGFDIPDIQSIQHKYHNKLMEQTKEIFRRWRKFEHPEPNCSTLVKALQRIGLLGCLREINLLQKK